MRQSTNEIQFDRTRRGDQNSVRTSFRAGVVAPLGMVPVMRGDSGAGRVSISLALAEMPKPIENAVIARAQAWFVPRPALPQFAGIDEYLHAFQGRSITALGQATRAAQNLFATETSGAAITALANSELFTTMGIHLVSGEPVNLDYVDAFNLVYNFRLAEHSSKLPRRSYYAEDAAGSVTLPPAFWPRSRMHSVVPDYERALVVGQLDLDVTAGQIPVRAATAGAGDRNVYRDAATGNIYLNGGSASDALYADMAGEVVPTSLADIDKARTTQAFAKLLANYAGVDHSGFNNDDVIISELMQGYKVEDDLYNRPWLLDSKTVSFGMLERHATDAANLDDSVSTGTAQAVLSINLPRNEYGGVIVYTVEVMPELLTERASDEYLYVTNSDGLPNALRDIQRVEPVDNVLSRRIDTAHTSPASLYGYEPMNDKWRRQFTRLGGEFRSATPGAHVTTARTAVWQAEIVDPVFADDHFLCPSPFPQDVFSVPGNDAVNCIAFSDIVFSGITQFGAPLVEDNAEFVRVEAEQV